jgi:hypothetical protein
MGFHKPFTVPWRPVSKTIMASWFLVLGVHVFFSSISCVSAQYYCLYNFQNTGSNFALVRHAPDPGTWYTATFVSDFPLGFRKIMAKQMHVLQLTVKKIHLFLTS